MEERFEIEIPARFTEPLLRLAAETEQPLEDIVEIAFRNYLQGGQDNG